MRHLGEVLQAEFTDPKDPFNILSVAFRLAMLQRETAKELALANGEFEKEKFPEVVGASH